jgi:GNAT superfamily N-acetyltransferase
MPKIQRQDVPRLLMDHIITRAIERGIGLDGLHQFAHWLAGDPEVPEGEWFKRFGNFTVCGRGSLVTTFLERRQSATGTEVG